MREKIYCKDCKWYEQGRALCHRVAPCVLPSLTDSRTYFSLFPCTAPDEYCGMAESIEKAEPEFVAVGKIEAGDAVYICKHGAFDELKAENEELRDLILEVNNFLCYGAMAGDYRLKQKYVKKIHKIASDEFEKRIKDNK